MRARCPLNFSIDRQRIHHQLRRAISAHFVRGRQMDPASDGQLTDTGLNGTLPLPGSDDSSAEKWLGRVVDLRPEDLCVQHLRKTERAMGNWS